MRLQTNTSRKARILSVSAALGVGVALAVGSAVAQQNQNFDNVQIDTVKVRDDVHMLVGAGGNTTIFTGPEGILVVDTQFAPLSTKLLAAIQSGPNRAIAVTLFEWSGEGEQRVNYPWRRLDDAASLDRFARELASLITSGPAGLAGYAAGRPTVRKTYRYQPLLVAKEAITAQVQVRPAKEWADER